MIKSIQINILVIGSGLAGVVAAISVADKGKQVTIITKTPDLKSGNTPCAQGGIVFQCKTDSLEKLKSDIIGLRNGVQTAIAIISATLEARESRGTHYLIEDAE